GNNNQTPPNNQGSYAESSLPNGDVDDFIAGYRGGSPSAEWWKDHLDVAGYYNFRANATWVHDYDIHAGKNYFFFHNPETDKWQVVNWDLDLTWTTTYGGGGPRGPLSDDVLAIPEFALGYRNQVRHLQDLLHNPEQQGMLLDEIAHWVYTPGRNSMVDADRAMWDYNPILTSRYINSSKAGHGRYYEAATTGGATLRSFPGMVAKLKSYVAGRRSFMTTSYLNADESSVPRKPVVTYTGVAGFPVNDLSFTSSSFSSPRGANFVAQQWRIAEVTLPGDPRFDAADPLYDRYAERRYEIEPEWESGDVTTTDFAVTVPADVVRPGRLYRVRTKMLDSAGRWGRWSEPVEFVATAPDVSEYTDNLWITEFMYHPEEPSGGELGVSTDEDDFEFIELKNVGTGVLDLRDVRFTKGVDFDFGGSTIEEVAPGAFVLVVRDVAAFEARYGGGLPVAGAYGGDRLSNGGERLKLSFGAGVPIHDIDPYDDVAPWPAAADGTGASLVLVAGDAGVTPEHGDPVNWRVSEVSGG
ncbi:MAG: CotH kinase family protein, partial [Verrucomicrobiales bacterium]|nr:CotH kinase family protein [Verrucomicrobiales bacterium]